jgi:predicted negative regulator of RcsB-dependent stress response
MFKKKISNDDKEKKKFQEEFSQAIVLYAKKQYKEVLEILETKNNLNNFRLFYFKGNCLRKLQKFNEAIESYEKSTQMNSNHFKSFYNKG